MRRPRNGLSDLRVSRGSRTEWLRVVDPGIIPQRPSSPNAAVDPDRSDVAGALRIFVVPHAIVQLDARTPALRSAAAHCHPWRRLKSARASCRAIIGSRDCWAPMPASSRRRQIRWRPPRWSVPLVAIPLVLWILQTASRWLWCFFFAALLLPPLPFAFGNSGPHVGVALAGLGLVCGALRLREWRLKRNLLTFAMAVFFLVLLC